MKLPAVFREVYDDLFSAEGNTFVLRLSALLIMFYGASFFPMKVLLRVLAGVMLFSPRLLQSRRYWLLMFVLCITTTATRWPVADNHKWLIAWWVLACAVAVGYEAGTARRVLAANATLLIGTCFTFATFWKFFGGDYLDGTFFVFELQYDSRFSGLAKALGLSASQLAENARSYSNLRVDTFEGKALPAVQTDAMRWFAIGACYWTILIEGSVALSFLFKKPQWLHERRDLILIAFIGTTYFLAPVHGFGFVLLCMGLAQCDPKRTKTRVLYLLTILVLHVANPWSKLLWRNFLRGFVRRQFDIDFG